MSYGYNPVSALQGDVPSPTARVVDGIVFSSAVHNDAYPNSTPTRHSVSTGKRVRPSKIPTHYLNTVRKRIEIINEGLAQKNMSYRFHLHVENKRAYVGLMIKNSEGRFTREHTHEVTPDNFGSLLNKMSSGEGFIFDD